MQIVKEIVRKIKYRELTASIGQSVLIDGIESIEGALLQQLNAILPDGSTMQPKERKYFERAIAKYGLIDVGFEVSNALLEENYRSGISLLRDVKFFPEIPSDDPDAVAVLEDILQDMLDELSLSKIFMLLFLETPFKKPSKLRLELDFFPSTFVVRDACLTNISSIWINKHFYF